MFEDFFGQVTGKELSAEQQTIIADSIELLHRQDL